MAARLVSVSVGGKQAGNGPFDHGALRPMGNRVVAGNMQQGLAVSH